MSSNPSPEVQRSYRSRRHLLSPGERRFFLDGLQPAVGNRYLISFKVRLTDIIMAENWESPHGRRIAQKHVDFVLTTPRTTRIVAVVELNDASHIEASRQERDLFVAEALTSVCIPCIAVPIYRNYDPLKLRQWIFSRIDDARNSSRTS